tara:strand:+ start:189 stop:713 length:525 start_codon:yes stop_codon:yes gene_type:complete
MKYISKTIVIISFLFFCNLSYSNSGLAYINMEILMNKSKAGQSISIELEKEKEKNFKQFQLIEKELKKEEDDIVSQKNILKKEDYEKKVNELKKKINEYNFNRKEKMENFNKKKLKATNELLDKIRPILADYSVKNSLSIILEQKNIVLGKKDLDITNNILKIVDKTFTKIDLN